MDSELNIKIAKLELLKEGSGAHLLTKQISTVPHYVMDISADGVSVANNNTIPSANPICGRLFSIQPSALSATGIKYFSRPEPEPFVIGFLTFFTLQSKTMLHFWTLPFLNSCVFLLLMKTRKRHQVVRVLSSCVVSLRTCLWDLFWSEPNFTRGIGLEQKQKKWRKT